MFRYWVDIDLDDVTWTENNMSIPLNMVYGFSNRIRMDYDIGHLVVIF